jgi:hypothetical protein
MILLVEGAVEINVLISVSVTGLVYLSIISPPKSERAAELNIPLYESGIFLILSVV